MGRRLKQRELLDLIYQTQEDLDVVAPHYPLPPLDGDQPTYLQQLRARQVLQGRQDGLTRAATQIALRSRWGPVNQARAHDALLNLAQQIWQDREMQLTLLGTQQRGRAEIAARTASYTGQLDALHAVSKAIAGYPEQVQALPDLEHPERARTHSRSRDRDRGAGY